ncbi:hypothetical protein PMIN06_005337 [Paraphaeosphaeria minitans]
MIHQGSRPSISRSTPAAVQQNFEKASRSYLPIRHDRRLPSPTKRPRQQSAATATAMIGANISNNDSIQTPHLQNNRISSPCGRSFSSLGWLKRHQVSCSACKNMNSKERSPEQVIPCAPLASKRQAIPQSREIRAAMVGEEQLGVNGWSTLSVNREAPRDFGSGRDPVSFLPVVENQPDAVHATTFNLGDEYNPEGELVTNSAKFEINATELHNKVRAELERELTPNDSEGYIYILWDPNRPELHKIGKSIESTPRKGQLENQCGLALELVKEVRVDYYYRNERLIQTYLLDRCRPYRCEVCGANHKEWFQIAAESASAAVSLWTKFMNEEAPYDLETRQLRSFAKDLVKRQDRLLADVKYNVEATREHWNRVLSPTFIDRFRFKFNIVRDLLWKFYWQINTMLAWIVAFIASRHPVAFLCIVVSVIGTFISMSDEHNRLRNRSKSSKRRSM